MFIANDGELLAANFIYFLNRAGKSGSRNCNRYVSGPLW